MRKEIVYIDLDGVVADFEGGLLRKMPNIFEIENRDGLIDQLIESDLSFFENLEPIPGSVWRIKRLMKVYDVYFLSTPMWSAPHSFSGKRIWVEKYFGDEAKKRLILTHRKDLCIGEYLIDDRLKNGAGEFGGVHIHYGQESFPDWFTVENYLMSKLK